MKSEINRAKTSILELLQGSQCSFFLFLKNTLEKKNYDSHTLDIGDYEFTEKNQTNAKPR